jgi:MFS family permease
LEWSRSNAHRGFVAAWPQLGVPAGLFLANLAVLAFSAISGEQFATWGWRIPFLLSIALVAIGLWIRLGILETPAFRRVVEAGAVERAPLAEVWRRHPREIVLSALVRMSEQAPFYIFTAFVFSYGTTTLRVSRDLLLVSVLVASVLSLVTVPLAGHLSDRYGRRRVYILGAALTGVFGWLYFAMLNTVVPGWIMLAIVLSLIPHDLQYGPQAALIAESFPARLRYSGASLGYQLASIIAGGPAPLIAAALFARYQSGTPIAAFISICAVISIAAAVALNDYTNRDAAG